MNITCNFNDAEKIRTMFEEKYIDNPFKVVEERHPLSSLNNIVIYDNEEIVLYLEVTSDGYIIKEHSKYLLLDFIGNICECLA